VFKSEAKHEKNQAETAPKKEEQNQVKNTSKIFTITP